jgi:hypothetical protein
MKAQRREQTHDGCGHGARRHHQIVVLCDSAVRNHLISPRADPLQGAGPHQPGEGASVDAELGDVSRPQSRTCPGELQQSLSGISTSWCFAYTHLPVAGLGLRVQAVTLPLDRTRLRVHIIADVSGDSFRLSEQGGRFVEQLDFALLTVDAKGHRDNAKATTELNVLRAAVRRRNREGNQNPNAIILQCAANPASSLCRASAEIAAQTCALSTKQRASFETPHRGIAAGHGGE